MQSPTKKMPLAYLRTVESIYEIEKSITTIGRKDSNDVVINEKTVSSNHAVLEISKDASKAMIRDLGSTNGTFIGDSKISKEGKEIFSNISLRFGYSKNSFRFTLAKDVNFNKENVPLPSPILSPNVRMARERINLENNNKFYDSLEHSSTVVTKSPSQEALAELKDSISHLNDLRRLLAVSEGRLAKCIENVPDGSNVEDFPDIMIEIKKHRSKIESLVKQVADIEKNIKSIDSNKLKSSQLLEQSWVPQTGSSVSYTTAIGVDHLSTTTPQKANILTKALNDSVHNLLATYNNELSEHDGISEPSVVRKDLSQETLNYSMGDAKEDEFDPFGNNQDGGDQSMAPDDDSDGSFLKTRKKKSISPTKNTIQSSLSLSSSGSPIKLSVEQEKLLSSQQQYALELKILEDAGDSGSSEEKLLRSLKIEELSGKIREINMHIASLQGTSDLLDVDIFDNVINGDENVNHLEEKKEFKRKVVLQSIISMKDRSHCKMAWNAWKKNIQVSEDKYLPQVPASENVNIMIKNNEKDERKRKVLMKVLMNLRVQKVHNFQLVNLGFLSWKFYLEIQKNHLISRSRSIKRCLVGLDKTKKFCYFIKWKKIYSTQAILKRVMIKMHKIILGKQFNIWKDTVLHRNTTLLNGLNTYTISLQAKLSDCESNLNNTSLELDTLLRNDWARTLVAQKTELTYLRSTLIEQESQINSLQNELTKSFTLGTPIPPSELQNFMQRKTAEVTILKKKLFLLEQRQGKGVHAWTSLQEDNNNLIVKCNRYKSLAEKQSSTMIDLVNQRDKRIKQLNAELANLASENNENSSINKMNSISGNKRKIAAALLVNQIHENSLETINSIQQIIKENSKLKRELDLSREQFFSSAEKGGKDVEANVIIRDLKDEVEELRLQTSYIKEFDHGIVIDNLEKKIAELEKKNKQLEVENIGLKSSMKIDINKDELILSLSKALEKIEKSKGQSSLIKRPFF